METKSDSDRSLILLIADHMENGFLENIIDMFRHDSSLYLLVGSLIQDERVRVRVGITALMEELKKLDSQHISGAVAGLLPLLTHTKPFVRGDACNLLGIIGDKDTMSYIEKLLIDENFDVRLIAKESIEDILKRDA